MKATNIHVILRISVIGGVQLLIITSTYNTYIGFGFLIHLNVDGIKQTYLETPQSNVR